MVYSTLNLSRNSAETQQEFKKNRISGETQQQFSRNTAEKLAETQ